jgi:hypothetical protein
MTDETEIPKKKDPSAPSILLLGDAGRGKTFSLGTLAREVDKFFYLFTDPGGDESLIDSCRYYDVPLSKVHYHYVSPASTSWDSIEDLGKKVNALDFQALAGIKSGINKQDHKQFFEIIAALRNFTCERTGKDFGAADEWPNTYALAFDSLTGLNTISKETTVGSKPSLAQGEWGTAMELEEKLIRRFVSAIKCPRVMVGHLEKSRNEITSEVTFSVSLLGNKLAPKIPTLFSDVIYAYTSGVDFLWSNIDDRIALKSRNLKLGQRHKPDFGPIMASWKQRMKEVEEANNES